jgi:hypothetical protein
MKNSFASATKWKNGLSASRPKTIGAASASAAGGNEPADQRRAQAAFAAAREGPRHDEQRRDREILE